MQKESATMPGSETLSPFFAADIRTSYFSADVVKNCALIALRAIAEEGRGEDVGCRARGLGVEGNLVVQRVQYGKVKTKACLQVTLEKTMCATKRYPRTPKDWQVWAKSLGHMVGGGRQSFREHLAEGRAAVASEKVSQRRVAGGRVRKPRSPGFHTITPGTPNVLFGWATALRGHNSTRRRPKR